MTCDPRPTPERLSLRTAEDLLAVIPFLIGFHPADSLVLVGFADSRVHFAARADLPPPHDPGAIRQLAAIARKQDIDSATLVGYGPESQVGPAILDLCVAVEQTGLPVREALRVTENRYWSYLCQDPDCCPSEGTPFQIDTNPVAASAVVAGYVALPDRATMEQQLAPVAGAERKAMTAALTEAEKRLRTTPGDPAAREELVRDAGRLLDEAVRRYAAGGRLDDAAAARLLVLLSMPPVADLAWQRAHPEACPGHVALWQDLTRRASEKHVPTVAVLLAYHAWLSGNGALAGMAVQRALSVDSRYKPALVMEELVAAGTSPPGHGRGADPDLSHGSRL